MKMKYKFFLIVVLFVFFALARVVIADPEITLSYDTGSNIPEGSSTSSTVAYFVSNDGNLTLTDPNFTVELLFSNNWKLKTSASFNINYEALAADNYFYTITVNGETVSEVFGLAIGDTNETPVINTQSYTVNEGIGLYEVACSVIAADPENDPLTYSLLSGSSNFGITAATGEIYPINTLVAGTTYALNVRADDGEYSPTGIVNIIVSNTNDPPSINDQNFSVNENSSNGALVDTIAASDPESDTLTYGVISGNEAGAFAVNSTNGKVTVNNGNLLNYENIQTYTLTVFAKDFEYTATAELVIDINDINETPVINSQSYSVSEDAANNTVIASIAASDPEADQLTYTITGGNTNSAFIISSSGDLKVNDTTQFDFETKTLWNLDIDVTDGTFIDNAVVAINILNANDNAPVINNRICYVSKTSQNGTVVDTVVATDADNDTITYAIESGNTNNLFAIDPSTGEITVANDTQLAEPLMTYNLVVSADDGVHHQNANVTVNITIQNYAPSIEIDPTKHTNINTMSEPICFTINDANGGAISVTAMSSDPALVPNDDAHIIISGQGQGVEVITSGNVKKYLTITVMPASGQTGNVTITLCASDSGNLSTTRSFNVLVDYIPELQNINDDTIDEDAISGPHSFTLIDSDNHPLTITVESSDNTLADPTDITIANATPTALSNTYTITGTSVEQTLNITVEPKANMFGSTTITVSIDDSHNEPVTDSFLLTVNSVNDTPTITSIADQTYDEDNASGDLSFTVTDVETDDGSLVVTAISSDQSIVSNANITLGGSGSSRTISLMPTADEHGFLSITVSVSDGSLSATTQFDVTYVNVNDTPLIGSIADQTINEDAVSGPLSFTVFDADNEPLTVTVSSSDTTLLPVSNILISGTGGSRSVTLTPVADEFGSSTITLTVNDADNATSQISFLLTVSSVNDLPTMTSFSDQTIPENAAITPVEFTMTDVDTTSCTFGITISSSNQTLMPDANLSNVCSTNIYTISGTPAINQSGTTTITVTAEDADGATVSDTFVITVNSVNQAPQLSTIATQTGTRNMTSVVGFSLTETDADIVTLSAESSDTNVVPVANIVFSGTGMNTNGSDYSITTAIDVIYPLYVYITPALNQTGTVSITLIATDSQGVSTTTAFTYLLSVPEPGYAVSLNGVDDYVDLGAGINLANSSFTIEFWANRQAINENQAIIGQGGDNPLLIGFDKNNQFIFEMGQAKGLTSTHAYGYSEWHHWAVTYDSTSNVQTIYLDGIQYASGTAASDYADTGTIYIGKKTWAYDETRQFNQIYLGDDITGNLTSQYSSSNYSGSPYANYYTFSIYQKTYVNIETTTISNPYLYLMEGFSTNGSIMFSASDINCTLEPGNYTLEVTSTSSYSGAYTVRIYPYGETYGLNMNQNFKGFLDEIRIWNVARTASDIRNTMTQSLDGNESGLLAYYNCNSTSGTILSDMTSNANHGDLTASWIVSDIPLGNASVCDYSGSVPEDFQVTLSHTSGDSLSAKGDGGAISGLHLYRVDQQSSNSAPSDWSAIDTDHYWGVYPVGTYATYSITYNYSGNSVIVDPNNSRLACRTQNQDDWLDCAAILDTGDSTLTKSEIVSHQFIAGQSQSPMILYISDQPTAKQPVNLTIYDADGGNVTISATSSDQSIVPDANINIGGSGSNSHVVSTTAGVFANLTLTMNQLTDTHDRITITVTATDSGGLASSTNFHVIVSPPAAGKSLNFNYSDYIEIGGLVNSLSNRRQFTFECWFKGTSAYALFYIGNSNNYVSFGDSDHRINRYNLNTEYVYSGNRSVINDENWHHLAVTWKRNTQNGFRSYFDGVLVASMDTQDLDLPDFTNQSAWIGKDYNSSGPWGQIDEFRIWEYARTAEDIRQNMCRHLNGSEDGLLAYIRFDHPNGTTEIEELTGNPNLTLTMYNSNPSNNWIVSGAAIGDTSTYLYDNGNLGSNYSVNMTRADGDSMTVTGLSGHFEGLQLYLVDETPVNHSAPSEWNLLHTDYYWGVFAPGLHTQYQLIYNYAGLTGITTENNLKIASRSAANELWTELEESILDTGTQTISRTDMDRAEYIPGETNTTSVTGLDTLIIDTNAVAGPFSFSIADADGGMITIIAESSNTSLITNTNINIGGAGTYSTTVSLTAGVWQALSIVVVPETSTCGTVDIMLTLMDDTGNLTYMTFTVDIIPPGAGNALYFPMNTPQYIQIPAHAFSQSYSEMSISFWTYGQPDTTYETTLIYAEDSSYNELFSFKLPNSSRQMYYYGPMGMEYHSYYLETTEYKGQWNHWAITRNADTQELKFYFNGILQDTAYAANYPIENITRLKIGCYSQGGSNFYGTIDEFRIWDYARSQTEIRQDMCKKLTGSETGLILYYRFDQGSGTKIFDATSHANHGELYETYDQNRWIRSNAPIGDMSAFDYDGTTAGSFSVSLTDVANEKVTVIGESGFYSGLHVYRVDAAPAGLTPPVLWTGLDSDHYWGAFPIGTGTTAQIVYQYTGSTAVSIENDTQLAFRTQVENDWSGISGILNTSSHCITATTSYSRVEFVLGESKTPVIYPIENPKSIKYPVSLTISDSDGGNLTVCVASGSSVITNTQININSSGSNEYVFNATAGGFENLSIVFTRTSTGQAIIPITVTVTDASNLSSTYYFNIELMSGPGYAFHNDAYHDILVPNDRSLNLGPNRTIETWVYFDTISNATRYLVYKTSVCEINYRDTFLYYYNSQNYYLYYRLQPKTWIHLAIVTDDSNIYLYINGTLARTVENMYGGAGVSYNDLYIGSSGGSYFYGMMDEFRLWNCARTADEIRQYMCQPLTGNEADLRLYYKFDQTSGSVVTDHSLYKNHGISRNSDWQISGAAIGDVSTYDYDGSIASDFQVMLSHPTGDSITITGDGDSGYYSGLQLYYVDQAPANFEPPANWTLIDTDHYWGVFPVGNAPTYNIDYNYSGIDSYTIENDIKLTMRNNAAENWQDAAAHLNTTNQTLQKSYHENHSEFVLGQGKTPTIFDIADQTSTKDAVDFSVVDSDGGILTVTVSMGEGSSLTQVSFDINGSGSSSVTVTTSAGVSADLSLTISRLTNAMGDLTVNVIVTDAQGLTSSTQYQTSFMPGPGYAFQFSDNDYVTVLHDESLSFTQMTLETWINLYNHNASKYPIYKGNDFYIYITSSTIEFYNGSSTFSVNLVIPDDKWVHIACVYDVTQTMYIYVNGLLKFQQASDPGSTLYTAPMYIGSDGSNTIYGTMDETRIWNYGRTAAQIRESMCKKLNGNEPGLVAYYRFDHVDGSVLKDYSIYNNHATMTSIEDASWVISDAPIGDASAFDYTGSAAADFSVALTHTMGDSLYVTGDGGTYSAIHMYRVDDIPNVTTPPANWTFIDPDHYWGVYAVGGSPTFSMSYHYSGNTAITIENDTRLAYRNDASDTTWEDTVSSINTSTKVVSNTELVNGDFIMGAGKAPSIFRVNNQKTAHTPVSITVSDSDGGMLTVTAVSSDVSMISNSMINLAGSGSNSLTLNSTAGVPQSFTMTFDQTSTIHGKVIITVMIADSQGLTGTQQFTVLISPPGAGNMLHFIDSNDYIDIPDHTSLDVNQNCTFEFWYKAYTLTTTDQCIFQKSGAYSLEIDNHWIYFNNQTNSYNLNNTVLSINTWYHIAVVIDSSNGCRIFVNGKQQSYQSASNDGGISTSSLRIGNSSYPITGYIDEFRIWGVPRTETQIRDHMCRRLNGDETGLVAYYRFDHTSGTTLLDMTSNGNNGTLYNMVDTQWMGSEAPIGDDSAHDYVGAAASDFQAVYTHSDGDSFTATGESGNYTAMHIYMVNTYPGFGTLPEGWDTLDSNRFYGVFPAALTGCTYSASYGYTGNSYINDKASLKWATRTDASESWDRSEALQDYATGKLELTNQTRSEYILGAGVNPPVVSGLSDLASAGIDEIDFSVSVSDSATVTITTSSSDSSLISNLNINSTGSDELIDSFTANVAQDISLTFDQNASEHGKVSVTVIVSSSEGVATTTTFTVILSPPGSGNALVFDGVDDYVDLGNTDALKQTGAFSYELWMYSSDWASVVGTAFGNTEGSGYALYFNADTILTNVYADGAGYYNANASKSILTNGWHHFAFTFDGQQLSLYIDGDLKTLTNIGSNKTVYHHASNSTLLGAEVGTSNTATGAYVSVIIDELRFWNVARSAAQIRTNMCKKITGSETGLTAYYRFDNSSGTSLIDLSNNNNDGILNNMDNSNWVTSGAAIGDDSAYDYAGSVASDYSVSIAHADGDQFTATGESGTYTGIHVYLVNESPNTTTIPDGYTSMDTDHYYGVFPVGITPTFSVAYNYSGNTYAADDSNLQIAYRTNNAGSWTGFASTQYTSTTTVVKTGISAFSGISATEFILGKNEPPVMVADEEAQSPYFDSLTYHTLAVKDDGTVWAWGKNDNGEVGNGTTTGPQTTPGNVSGLSNVIDVEAGYLFSLAVQDDGTVWEWGENTSISGQTAKSTPVQVTELENIVQVSAGNNHALALKNDGTVWTWGRNDYGQLGIGTTTDEIDPVQISGLNNVSEIYAGSSYSFVLKNDGTVWAWGVNSYGQLGNGNTTNQTSPVQISGLTNVTFISPHSWHTLFLKNDGTVWAVGYNAEGELGNGTNTDSSTPVQVSGLTNVMQVCAGSQHNIALKDDGTVWVWGKNNYGQLGNGTTTSENTPIQVSGLSNIITLSAGSGHSLAMQSDGTYWAWGKNNTGELGDGTITDRSSPVHITETFITGNAQLSFTTSEDTALTISYSITDAESSACGLTLSMVSSDSSLITDSNFSFTCNADTYIVSITPVENLYGSATVTIIAKDAGGLTDSDSFSIDITEVNDAPTVTSISSLSLTENASSSAITFTITDLESNATDLTVTASSSNTSLVDNSNIVIEGTDASRTISITPTANEYGLVTITISLYDGDLTATTAFVLTINNILEIGDIADQTTLEDTATGAISFVLTGVSSSGATIDYSFEYTFGSMGSAAGQFEMAKDVALDSSGYIYVADYSNHRIQVFSSPGTFSYSVGTGSMGSGPYGYEFPNAIHIDDTGKIYVVDQGSNSIKVYTSAFVFDYSITTGSPYDVSVDSSGNIYVADTSGGGAIQVYTSDGNYYTSLCADHLNSPKAVAVDSAGKIYVVDNDAMTHRVKVFSSSGAIEYTLGTSSSGSADGEFYDPSGIAVDSSGNIFVADTMNQRIQIFSSSGAFEYSLGTEGVYGSAAGQFDSPANMYLDSNDNLYVAELTGNRVQKFTNNAQDSLTLSALSSYTPLVSDTGITFGGSGANRTIDILPEVNQYGMVTITVIASDGDLTATTAFQLTVTSVNDGPTFATTPEMASNELSFTFTSAISTTVSLTVTSSDLSLIDDSAINVSGSGTNSNSFSTTANIANSVSIQYTPVSNAHGLVTLTVTASAAGDTTTQTYAVIVSPPGSGNALNFDGSDDYISLPSISWINGDFTCEAWIYLRSHVQGTRLFDFGNGAPSDNIVLMFMGAGPIQLQVFNGGAQKDFSPNYIIPLFKWIHIAYKIEGTTATFYVNGEQRDYTNDIYAPNNVTRTSNYIAKSNWTNAYPDAIFDEIRFWNTARTETELRDNMCKKLDGNETGLMAYYRFDHSSGTTLADLTGNGNDGTLHNTIDTNWITSGAALGDDSVYDYAGSVFSDFSASIAHADGDQFTATGDGGTYTGIQVYIVNESPNTTTPPDAYTSIDTDHYYGVFPVGVTPTYSIAYDYSGNAYASDDSSLQIAYRTSNSGEWTGMVSTKYTSTTMLVKTGISAFSGISATEFILGMNVPPVFSVPTIGPVDINEGTPYTMTKTITDAESSACGLSLTMTSSDSALFTSTNFTYSCNADTYTIRITPTTHMIGSATVTMIVTDAGGLTASDSFEIAVNPVYYTIAGHVSYYTDIAGSDLEGVTLTLTGTYSYSMVSDAFGYYTFSTVRPGDYTLTASKSDDISLDIADAIKILNACARLNSLTCLEQIAADAYIDGRYNSYDAALVAGYIAGIDTCLNDSCTFWQFLPENIVSCETWPLIEFENVRQYTDLTGDTFGQDFIGIGCGNVSE